MKDKLLYIITALLIACDAALIGILATQPRCEYNGTEAVCIRIK